MVRFPLAWNKSITTGTRESTQILVVLIQPKALTHFALMAMPSAKQAQSQACRDLCVIHLIMLSSI